MQNKEYQDFFTNNQTTWLKEEVERKLSQIYHLQDASIMVMVSLAEFRDECTGWHIRRTQELIGILAQNSLLCLNLKPSFLQEYIDRLKKSAPLHDIGKIAIPDTILLKPGKLDENEMAIMKTHAQKGIDIRSSTKVILKQVQNF